MNGGAQSQLAALSSYAVRKRLLVNLPTSKSAFANIIVSTVVSKASSMFGLASSSPELLLRRGGYRMGRREGERVVTHEEATEDVRQLVRAVTEAKSK